MGDLFTAIYRLAFDWFYGLDLADYLEGQFSTSEANQFAWYGTVLLVVAAVIAAVYYLLINKPNWNRWICWFVVAGINSGLQFLIASVGTISDLNQGLMVRTDEATQKTVELDVTVGHCLAFAFVNAVLAFVFFYFISLVVKRFSSNCRNYPLP